MSHSRHAHHIACVLYCLASISRNPECRGLVSGFWQTLMYAVSIEYHLQWKLLKQIWFIEAVYDTGLIARSDKYTPHTLIKLLFAIFPTIHGAY